MVYMDLMELVPVSLDEQLSTAAAVGRCVFTVVDIAYIDMLQSVGLGNRIGLQEFAHGGIGTVGHAKIGMKRREVHRHVGP